MLPAAPTSYLSATLPLTNLQSQDSGRGLGPKQGVEAWILLALAPQQQESFPPTAALISEQTYWSHHST